jgi:hypothetical protein
MGRARSGVSAPALPIYRQNQSDHLAGGSLDGYVYGFKGIIELKVPRSATPIMLR